MSVDYLTSLAGRSFGLIPVVQPRLPALFEPVRSGVEPLPLNADRPDTGDAFEETQEAKPWHAAPPASPLESRSLRAPAPKRTATRRSVSQASATGGEALDVRTEGLVHSVPRPTPGPSGSQMSGTNAESPHAHTETSARAVPPAVGRVQDAPHTFDVAVSPATPASSVGSSQTPSDRSVPMPLQEAEARGASENPDPPPMLPGARRVTSGTTTTTPHAPVSSQPAFDAEHAHGDVRRRAQPLRPMPPVSLEPSADRNMEPALRTAATRESSPNRLDRRDPAVPAFRVHSISMPALADVEPGATFSDTARATTSVGIVVQPRVRPRLDPVRPSLEVAAPSAPTIQVTIGRVELRATSPATPARTPRSGPHVMSLDDYLKQRSGGSA